MAHQKKLVEEVSFWLRLYDDGSVDRTWFGPPELKFMIEPVPPHEEFIDGVATRDVVIDETSGLAVRIYLPEKKPATSDRNDDDNKLPIILHFHGGGFCFSRPDWFMYYNAYTQLVRSAHAICVSVYLRLAPEHRLPAACNNGFSALLWLRSLAKGEAHEPWLNQFADFNRVFLIGDSTGGNVAHDVAARAGHMDMKPLRLAGAIPIHPGFVRSAKSKSELEKKGSPFFTLEMVDKFLGLALPLGCNKDHPITCPMGPEAQSLEGLNLPPFLLVVAENDLMYDTEMEYYEAMKKANKDVKLLINGGMEHSFYLNSIAVKMDPLTSSQTSALFDGIAEFIEKH